MSGGGGACLLADLRLTAAPECDVIALCGRRLLLVREWVAAGIGPPPHDVFVVLVPHNLRTTENCSGAKNTAARNAGETRRHVDQTHALTAAPGAIPNPSTAVTRRSYIMSLDISTWLAARGWGCGVVGFRFSVHYLGGTGSGSGSGSGPPSIVRDHVMHVRYL
jgi:hypothetical protein